MCSRSRNLVSEAKAQPGHDTSRLGGVASGPLPRAKQTRRGGCQEQAGAERGRGHPRGGAMDAEVERGEASEGHREHDRAVDSPPTHHGQRERVGPAQPRPPAGPRGTTGPGGSAEEGDQDEGVDRDRVGAGQGRRRASTGLDRETATTSPPTLNTVPAPESARTSSSNVGWTENVLVVPLPSSVHQSTRRLFRE